MTNKRKLTPQEIRSMTPEQWQEFRVESWKKKQEYYAKPTPDWYLKSRDSYIQFLQRLNKRKEFVAAGGPSKPTSLTQKVELLAGDDLDTFADE
ncbi:MAG: hypothetical protein LBS76_04875 [Mycoplasmataceae bacterium]|jgi:hypothetical protein|nr:hypothetical protein [Mycoplasmataceae bacterium]